MVKRNITTILDAIGLLLLAAGFAAAVYPLIEWVSIGVAGGVVLIGSWLADRETKGDEDDE